MFITTQDVWCFISVFDDWHGCYILHGRHFDSFSWHGIQWRHVWGVSLSITSVQGSPHVLMHHVGWQVCGDWQKQQHQHQHCQSNRRHSCLTGARHKTIWLTRWQLILQTWRDFQPSSPTFLVFLGSPLGEVNFLLGRGEKTLFQKQAGARTGGREWRGR